MTTTMPYPYSIDFARPLGGLEHFFSLIDQHRAVDFAMAAQVEGPTSIPAWRAALAKLQERRPLLSVVIDTNSGPAPHFRAVRDARIPLRIIQGPTASSWQTEIAAVGEDARGSDDATSSRALLPPPEWPAHAPVPSAVVFWENHFLDGGITDKVTWQFLETYTSDPKTTLRLVFPKAGSVELR